MLIEAYIGGFLYHPDVSSAWEILQGVFGPATRKIGPFRDRVWIDRPGLELYAEQTDFCQPMEYKFNVRMLTDRPAFAECLAALSSSTHSRGGLYVFHSSESEENGELLDESEFESPDFEARYKAMLAQHGPRPA